MAPPQLNRLVHLVDLLAYYYYYYYYYNHHSSLIVTPYYITLSPAVIERKAGPAVITRPTKYTLQFCTGAGNRHINAVSAGFGLMRGRTNSSHSNAWMRGCFSTQKYRGNGNSFAGIIVGAVRLFVRTQDYNLTRNSATADKPHDAFAQYAVAWLPPPQKK